MAVGTRHRTSQHKELVVPNSILDAIKLGHWDFEPDQVPDTDYDATRALPGSSKKLEIMAERVQRGLPLWHPSDALSFDDLAPDGDERN
jgi:hypothetical protein